MTSMIYTKNTSGAIRRARRRKPTRSYLSALLQHIKFLRTLGFKIDSKGNEMNNILATADGNTSGDGNANNTSRAGNGRGNANDTKQYKGKIKHRNKNSNIRIKKNMIRESSNYK